MLALVLMHAPQASAAGRCGSHPWCNTSLGPDARAGRLLNGRTFEAYGEDPYVDTQTTVRWIEGAQSRGVIADVKHFAANNQEGADPSGHTGVPGSPLGAGPFGSRYISNSVIDERTLREIYLPHFEAAVKRAGVGTVMCSYNMLNGQYACENHHLLQEILEREWASRATCSPTTAP